MEEVVNTYLGVEKIYLLVFMILYFGVVLGLRTLILYIRTGISPWQKFGKKSGHHLAERLIPLAGLLLLIIGGNYFFLEENIKYLLPFQFLDFLWLKHLGLVFSIGGLVVTFTAQMQMKDSWRIGLDKNNDIKLVDTGIFAYSRNPIYVSLMVSYIGVFFIVPGLVSLVFVILMALAMHIKAKDEEDFMEKKLGNEYLEYKNRVRRWI